MWARGVDAASGHEYYHNAQHGSQWERPEGLDAPEFSVGSDMMGTIMGTQHTAPPIAEEDEEQPDPPPPSSPESMLANAVPEEPEPPTPAPGPVPIGKPRPPVPATALAAAAAPPPAVKQVRVAPPPPKQPCPPNNRLPRPGQPPPHHLKLRLA